MHQLAYISAKRKMERREAGMNERSFSEPLLPVRTHAEDETTEKTEYQMEELLKFKHAPDEFYISLHERTKDDELCKLKRECVKAELLAQIKKKIKLQEKGEYYEGFLKYILTQNSEKSVEVAEKVLKKYGRKPQEDEDLLPILKVELDEMHRKGLVLYYKENPLLEKVVWLNPAKTVEYIHSKVLSKKIKKDYNGIVPEDDFNKLCDDEQIKELLICEKVIFFDKKNRKGAKYIVPGYLKLFSEDEYSNIITFDFTKPNFILKFRYFIPFGLINQLICLYGDNPDDKMFWRDRLVFTYNGEYKICIELDFSQLTIAVYINPRQGVSQKHLNLKEMERVVFLNIIDLYWAKDPNQILNADRDKFNPKEKEQSRLFDEREIFAEKVRKNYLKYWQDKENAIDYSPEDMYLSVDGIHFVHHRELEDATERPDQIPAYKEIDTDAEIEDSETKKKIKIKVIERTASGTLPIYPFINFSNNNNLRSMKKIFISYSSEDYKYMVRLKKHLNLLNIFGIAETWSSDEISVEEWNPKIQKKLLDSDLVIFMLSVDFFYSEYITEKEVLVWTEDRKKHPEKKALCVIVHKFVDLDTLNPDSKELLTPVAKAILELSEWQYAPYGEEKTGEGAGKMRSKRKIIPLDNYEWDGRSLDDAFALIAGEIAKLFKSSK
jgi:internalin A